VEPFHLFRYLDEQAFRFNERKGTDAERFLKGILGVIGKRLRYVKLIGNEGDTTKPETTGPGETQENKKRHMRHKPFGGYFCGPLPA
jgi:hypothetical protein